MPSTQSVSEDIIQDCRQFITKTSTDLQGLQAFWQELQTVEFPAPPDWGYIFQKVFLHACLHGHKDVAHWLRAEFTAKLDPITQIAYRQTFSYGDVLLRKKEKQSQTR